MAYDETKIQRNSREKLGRAIDEIQKKCFSSILAAVEIRIGDLNQPENKPLRSQILRFSNDAIRNLKLELEKQYLVEYVSTTEDIIVVNPTRNFK
jgi:hypothetical protein